MSAPGQRHSPFPVVMRGYDRDQVTDHIRRLDAELQMIAADRDSAHAAADQLHEQLEQARGEVYRLRHEVDQLSVPPTTVAGMTERVSRMLQLATDEAAELRASARDEAAETVSVARQEAEAERESATADATRTRELAQEHADTLITDAEERAAAIDAEAQKTRAAAQDELEAAKDKAKKILADAEDEASRLRGAAHSIAMNRLARSREIAGAAHDAHKQILDHLAALRQHLGDLPGALAFSGDEQDLIDADDSKDLELLNRTLTGRDRFSSSDADAGASERTDVLDSVKSEDLPYDDYSPEEHSGEEYSAEQYSAERYGPADKASSANSASA